MALLSSSLLSRAGRARLHRMWCSALCVCVLAFFTSLTACSERHIPSSPSTTPALPSSTAANQTRLFDVGDRPKVIWTEIKPGFTQRLTWHPTIEGQTWRVIAEVVVTEAEASGASLIEQHLLEVSPSTSPLTTNPPAPPTDSEVPAPARTRRWRAVGPDFTDRSPIEAAPTEAKSLALFETLHGQLQLLALRFPLEPIGEGAFWDAALSDALAVGMVLESSDKDQAQVRVDWPVDPSMPTVRLLWGGADPRMPLRYRPQVGSQESATIAFSDVTAQVSGKASVALEPAPSQVLLTVTEASDNGAVRYTGQVSPPAPAAPQPFQGSLLVPPASPPPAAPSPADAPATQTLWSGAQTVVALPTEPVGLGARWAVRSPVQVGGWTLHRTAIYTLEHIDGDTIRLRVDGKQYTLSQPQNFSVDGPRKKLSLTLNALDATEQGTLTLDLKRLIPTAQLQLQLQTWITTQGAEHPTYTTTRATLSIQPSPPSPPPQP